MKKRWLGILLALCLLVCFAPAALAAEAPASTIFYVSATSGSGTPDGTQENPFTSLKEAVDAVPENGTATIYVMSDLTMEKCARYYGKDLTITSGDGGPYTVTRGEDFAQIQDAARSTYNPAMIEVDSTEGPGTASLTLSNIILDDNFLCEGEYFVQADSEGDGHTTVGSSEVANTEIVQDAIIATYNGVGTITLKDGAVLQNYGGMSAVRIASGELVMENGSKIIDTTEYPREKGLTGSFGPAGAVWIQGGTLTMNGGVIGGAENVAMTGRAVYVDSGTANVGGTIQNLKGTDAAWQGQNGVAIHLRSGGEATLTATGKITNVTGTNAGNNTAVWTQFCNFKTEAGSVISQVDDFPLLHFDDLEDSGGYCHEVYLNGTIQNCNSGSAWLLRSWYGQITFGEDSVIEGCSSSNAGGLIYSNNGSHYTFAGTIRNNRASNGMIYLANQGGGGVIATIEPTAHIVDNTGLGIRVNNSSNLTMNGGEIARNSGAGVRVSGKDQWAGVKFIMNDGIIADNGDVGVDAIIGGNSTVELNGGSIYGNGDGTEVAVWNDYTDSPNAYGFVSHNNLYISQGVLQGARTVEVQHGYDDFLGAVSLNRTLGTVTLDEGYGEVAWAFANPAAVTKMTELVTAETSRAKWTAAMKDAYWIKPNATSYHFTVTRPKDATKTDLYLAYIPLNADGSVPADAQLTLKKVGSGDQIDVTMDGLDADTSYAFMFFNSSEYTLTPDDITIYTGGGQGTEGNYETTGGFPKLTINNSVDLTSTGDLTSLEINGTDIPAADGKTRLDLLLEKLEVTYYLDGQRVENDEEAGEYTVELAWKDGLDNDDVRVNGNNVTLGEGTLIVRHIENTDEVQEGTNTYPLLTGEPTEPVENAVAIAKMGGWSGNTSPNYYTNNNEDFEIEDTSGIQLLDDGLLRYEGEDRQGPMEAKAEAYLGIPGEGQTYLYDFHYLDLVDSYNGNAWVSAQYGTTVYLPYPEGITAENADEKGVQVIHYKDLHREYGITGQDNIEQAIADCEMERMTVEFTDAGIKFDTERAGFSPFAIVWQTKAHTITATAGAGGSINPNGAVVVAEGADKTFTITPSNGYQIADVKVDGTSVGAVSTYTFTDVQGNHTIEATFKPKSTYIPPVQPADPDDTGVSDLLNTEDHIQYLFGYPDGTFGPENNMTRAEVAQMFYNLLLDQDVEITKTFDDVPANAWYAKAVNTLASLDIISGVGDNKFEPERSITRAEFTAMAMKFAVGGEEGENIFSDVDENDWFYDAVVNSIQYGWIHGYGDGTFRPQNPITRAEVTAIVNNMLGRAADEDFVDEHAEELTPFSDIEKHWAYYHIVEATNDHDYTKPSSGENWTKLN